MIEETRIVAAIKSSGVKSVVVLDDAYDPPVFDNKYAAELLSYLTDTASKDSLTAAGLGVNDITEMRKALEESEYNAEALARGIAALYGHYRKSSQNAKADPGGMFKALKGDLLRDLLPLVELLRKCGDITIQELGKDSDLGAVGEVDVIFVDYFLLGMENAGDGGIEEAEASYQRVITMVDKAAPGKRPSVILMSSQDVREKAEKYRAHIRKDGSENLVYASSFGFVLKTELTYTSKTFEIAEEAADALLDVFQAFEFGRTIHASLSAWFEAAHKAVHALQSDVAKLQLREFAYLTKFRLIEEGEPLLEYLEWFFGECLLDGVAKAFDGRVEVPGRSKIEEQAKRVEGAFDGPTATIAELYHRVRIASSKKAAPSINYKLGDIFLENGHDSITAIMTPECDLILRKGRRKAKKLLSVSGVLKPLNAPDSVISEFIQLEEPNGTRKSLSVDWDLKSIDNRLTAEGLREGDDPGDRLPAPGQSTKHWTYLGSLRPLYAQALQRDLLVDLGRSSIPVGPALAMAAVCQLFVATKDGKVCAIDTLANDKAHCWAIHSEYKPTLVFNRTYVSALLKALASLPEECRQPPSKLTPTLQAGFYAKLSGKGVVLNDHCFGLALVSEAPKSAGSSDFAWLLVSGLDATQKSQVAAEEKPIVAEALVAEGTDPVVKEAKKDA